MNLRNFMLGVRSGGSPTLNKARLVGLIYYVVSGYCKSKHIFFGGKWIKKLINLNFCM